VGEPAHDPIAIAALVAALPELEAKYLAAKAVSDLAEKELSVVQDRIDQAIQALKWSAPVGSKWATVRSQLANVGTPGQAVWGQGLAGGPNHRNAIHQDMVSGMLASQNIVRNDHI
jgi:hypothetical protein